MRAVSAALWLALAGALLQVASVFTDFYVYKDTRKSAWFGVAQTSEMILWSALLTLALVGLTAAGRSPVSGKSIGRILGVMGSLTALQVFYRMNAPPFDAEVPQHVSIVGTTCLYYCWPSQAVAAEVLSGMWMALAGCIMVAAGGVFYLYSGAAQDAPARPWIAAEQSGATPWLGMAGLGAVGQFVFGYTFFTFYRTVRANGVPTSWSGWLPAPHTAWLVFMVTVIVVSLVWQAVNKRAPLSPKPLGLAIAALGLVSAGRMAYRIYQPPFRMDAEIGPAAYLALASAVLIVFAGTTHSGLFARVERKP